MAEKKPPVGKGAESDEQAKVKKASTKKTDSVKKAAPKKKLAPKKKVTAEKKPVPKKQAAKKSMTATTAKSTEDSSKKPLQTDKTISSVSKAEGKAPVQTDTQTPPPKPDRIGKKITLWPWITLFALIGVTAYLLGGPLRKQDDTEPSAVTQQNPKTSPTPTSLGNVHEVEPVSPSPTEALIQGDEAKISQESKQAYTTPTSASDVAASPNKLSDQAANKTSSDETKAVQDPMVSRHGAETEETAPAEATPAAEQLVQEAPSDAPTPISIESISKPDESDAKASLSTTADVQARADRSDQDPQPPSHEADPSALAKQAPDTLSSSQDALNDSLPPTKPEDETTVSDGQSNGPSAEVGHTRQTADDKIQTKITAESPTISPEASSSETPDEGSQVVSSQAKAEPKGVIGMPVPEYTNKQHPVGAWENYWGRWRQNVPRQYLPAYSYSPYYHSMRQYPYNYYRQRNPFPAYRPYRPYQPHLSRESNN